MLVVVYEWHDICVHDICVHAHQTYKTLGFHSETLNITFSIDIWIYGYMMDINISIVIRERDQLLLSVRWRVVENVIKSIE